MNFDYTFLYEDKEDGDNVSLKFSTIERSIFIDKVCAFMEMIGFGLPDYISDDINELICDRISETHEMKRKWDESKLDSDSE